MNTVIHVVRGERTGTFMFMFMFMFMAKSGPSQCSRLEQKWSNSRPDGIPQRLTGASARSADGCDQLCTRVEAETPSADQYLWSCSGAVRAGKVVAAPARGGSASQSASASVAVCQRRVSPPAHEIRRSCLCGSS